MPTTEAMCGDCAGKGEYYAFCSWADPSQPYGIGSGMELMPCLACGGTGIDSRPDEWVLRAKRVYDWRRSEQLTLRQAATLLGVSVVQVSGAEHGRSDPTAIAAAIDAMGQER